MHVPALALTIDLPAPEAFDLLANPANLDAWLGDSWRGFRWSPEGTMRIEADSRSGVIDIWIHDFGAGEWEVLPVRVLAASVTRCLVLLTRVASKQVEVADSAGDLRRLELRLEAFLTGAGHPLGSGWM